MVERTIIGLLLAVLLSAAAYRVRTLTSSGAIAAAVTGTIVLGLGGWTSAVLLVVFFLSSSLLTRISGFIKPEMKAVFAKGGRRDARQVLANGALPAVFSILTVTNPGVNWLAGVVGALAAATADTWATEWGLLARRHPRRITDWKHVPPGTSGGITPIGTLGSLLGALLIGATASLLEASFQFLFAALVGGVLGSAFDSVLGATVQAQYLCGECGRVTEQHPVHKVCGTKTGYHSGLAWINNDLVNLFANAFGTLTALVWMG